MQVHVEALTPTSAVVLAYSAYLLNASEDSLDMWLGKYREDLCKARRNEPVASHVRTATALLTGTSLETMAATVRKPLRDER